MDIHDHDDEFDQGLAHDLPRLLTRRRLLQMAGVVGAAVLVGCGDDDDAASGSGSTSSSSSSSTSTTGGSGASCGEAIPEETAGPYPGDGTNGPDALSESGVVRSDIRSSFGSASGVAEGVPVTIELTLVDTANGCAPLVGAAVYLWHCDREGRYSMYSSGAEDENYLRGVQASDADGKLTFQSIFPACYAGRWPHIHFEVYESTSAATAGGTRYATSQLAIPKDACDTVYATDGYEQSVTNLAQLSLETDGIFSDGYDTQLAAVTGSVGSGYSYELTVPVDSSATSTGGAGFGGGGPGGPPPGM
jgi:protocatechuate 3,4-dioxygenase beta subunit